jgi:hypothetical protein
MCLLRLLLLSLWGPVGNKAGPKQGTPNARRPMPLRNAVVPVHQHKL